MAGAAWRACFAAAQQFALVDQQIQTPALRIQTHAVAAARQTQGPAKRRLRRHVQHDGAEGRAAHARVGDAQHVALAGQLARDRQVTGLGHARPAQGTGVLQQQAVVRAHVQRRVIDARGQVGQRGEDDGARLRLQQRRDWRRSA